MFIEKTSIKPGLGRSVRGALLAETESALEEMQQCMAELETVLAKPHLDRAKLITIRLKIAQLRLARSPLVGKIVAQLAGKVSEPETAFIQRLRSSHEELLRAAAAHTAKWPMDAIYSDWPAYKVATRQIAKAWMEKLKSDQQLIGSLLRGS